MKAFWGATSAGVFQLLCTRLDNGTLRAVMAVWHGVAKDAFRMRIRETLALAWCHARHGPTARLGHAVKLWKGAARRGRGGRRRARRMVARRGAHQVASCFHRWRGYERLSRRFMYPAPC